jgi:hypothetical protein
MLSELVTSGLLCFNSWLRGPVAQRLEQGTHNPLVPGSNPGGPSPESFRGCCTVVPRLRDEGGLFSPCDDSAASCDSTKPNFIFDF